VIDLEVDQRNSLSAISPDQIVSVLQDIQKQNASTIEDVKLVTMAAFEDVQSRMEDLSGSMRTQVNNLKESLQTQLSTLGDRVDKIEKEDKLPRKESPMQFSRELSKTDPQSTAAPTYSSCNFRDGLTRPIEPHRIAHFLGGLNYPLNSLLSYFIHVFLGGVAYVRRGGSLTGRIWP
jgi:hypothetical protein